MKSDISIIGDLCDLDHSFCSSLQRIGLDAQALRRKDSFKSEEEIHPDNTRRSMREVCAYSSPLELLKICFKTKLIISFTGTLAFELGKLLPFKFLPGFPPVINIFTGSDITELAGQSSWNAMIYRFHLRTSAINWCPPYPYALKNVIQHNIPNILFMGYPYTLAKPSTYEPNSPLIFFHPSRMDWKVNDPGVHRNSSKGNNRFITAFIRALEDGLNAKCIILENGVDIEEAKAVIGNSKVANNFIWKNKMTQCELLDAYKHADVVVDQFDIGGLGGISIEAMSVGRPVLTYINECSNRIQYGFDIPPVLNCWSEEDIYRQIMRCEDVEHLKHTAMESLLWVEKYHNNKLCLEQFLFYYSMLTGDEVLDYGWLQNAYTKQEKR